MLHKKTVLYVLAGAWNTPISDGTIVIDVSYDINVLNKQLNVIKETKAGEYLENPHGHAEEVDAERFYEITDADGSYAKFYITEHYIN